MIAVVSVGSPAIKVTNYCLFLYINVSGDACDTLN